MLWDKRDSRGGELAAVFTPTTSFEHSHPIAYKPAAQAFVVCLVFGAGAPVPGVEGRDGYSTCSDKKAGGGEVERRDLVGENDRHWRQRFDEGKMMTRLSLRNIRFELSMELYEWSSSMMMSLNITLCPLCCSYVQRLFAAGQCFGRLSA